jgi:nicotinate-nucleotide adenylyltransferase
MRVALFGGSFDPPHLGHQMACLYLLERGAWDEVWCIPAFCHPFGKAMADFAHRLRCCQSMVRPFGVRAKVLDLERDLSGRTLDTVRTLKAQHPAHSFGLAIGTDLLAQCDTWFGIDQLRQEIPFTVIPRGAYVDGFAVPAVSSTDVRAGRFDLCPRSVEDYIQENGLYR